jgi:uracil-DNA glycosylase family 4
MEKSAVFESLVADIKSHQCSLRPTCIQAVPGDGSINSPVVFIGEAPGKKEDEQGRPFVGAAGQLLAEALNTIGWTREDVYITNVVKCRPPGNRDPEPSEVAEHHQFLQRELELIQPKIIVLLGRHALHWFLPELQISKVRGMAKRLNGQVYYPTYHPAAALYNGGLRETFISDIQKIPLILKKIAETPAPAGGPALSTEQDKLF